MPRLEVKVKIDAPAKKIYEILNDDTLESLWNLTVDSNTIIEKDKYHVKSNVGDFISIITDRIENELISFKMEGAIFSSMGYNLKPIGGETEVIGWANFPNEKQRKVLETAGGVLLDSLKRFVEYLEDGGNIDTYEKKEVLVLP
jgi:uncharacterized protein YndB with AHSA1/START domain